MRILFVTDLYPIGKENISKALFDFIREWKRQGHEVDVIRPNFTFNACIRDREIIKEKIYNENGIKIFNLNFMTPFWFDVRKKLPDDFSLYSYDVMISHMPSGALFAQRLLEKEQIKYVCSVHASDITVLKNFKYSFYFKNALENAYLKADKISARSPVLKRKIEEIIPETQGKTFTAYSGIDTGLFPAVPARKQFNRKKLKICTAASLIKRKNIDIIIKALAEYNGKFHLTIMGAGKEQKKLEKLANHLNLRSKIEFTGALNRNDVIKIMQENDIFVLLSSNETFGLVYLEAAAAGNIIIAKQNDGIDGIIKNGKNGFLIKPDSKELALYLEKIIHMNKTEIKTIRKNAAETGQNLTIKKAAENYIDNINV